MRQIRNLTLLKTYLFVGILLAMSFGASAQMTSTGTETLVNSTTTGNQSRPEVAMDASGNYVVVWESWDQDGMYYGIYFQRYDNTGTPVGTETLVNNTTNYSQREPDVAMSNDGSFVISWQSQFEDTDGWGAWFALYDNTGTLVQRNRVNDSSADEQQHARIAMAYDGRFVVGYADDGQDGDSWGVSYQGFNSSGVAQFAEVVPNTTTAGFQGMPDVAMDSAANYTWVWQSDDGDGFGIYGQRYSWTNSTVGSEFQINTTTTGHQQEPAIAMDYDGNAFVVWSSYAQDGDHFGIFGQLYDASGVAVGGEIQISTTTADVQSNANVSATKDGWVVSWVSYNQDGDAAGVYAQLIAPDGSLIGSEESINTTTSNYQMFPGVGGNPNNENATIAWQSGAYNSTSTQDGDEYGVYYQRYTVEDIIDPVANCQNITVYLDGSGNVSITAGDVDNGSTDEYGIVSYDIDVSAFTCANVGANTVTLTVTDAAGNSDNCLSTVTVLDTVSPTAVCQNLTVYLDGSGNASITSGDIDNGSTDNCSVASLAIDQSSFTCSDVGPVAVTLTVTDGSGNVSTCASTVTVLDTVSPSAVCQDITVYLDGSGNATITGADLDGGSTDNCTGTLSFSADITSFTCANIGSNSVTMTVTDPGGNIDACTATVTVLDTVSPTASCQDITVFLDGSGNATITTGDVDNGSTDNCSVASLGLDVSSFTCVNTGSNTVTLTVTDGSGNVSTCTSTVTVLDTVSPTASCQNLTVYLDGAGTASITTGDVDNGSTDNCAVSTLALDQSTFLCGNVGANTVTLTVTDASGNVSTCTSTVTVLDTISPVASCQDLTVYLDGAGTASITTGDVDNGSSDNCSVASSSLDVSTFTCANTGANTVTFTVTDASGNTSSCTSTVTVVDSTSPTASCQDITVYLDGSGNATITTGDVDNGSSDNCSIASMALDQTAFTCSDEGTNLVTLTVTDASGNVSTCSSNVIVLDTISPVVSCQDITVYLDGSGNATITAGDVDNGSTDNCDPPSLSIDVASFTCASTGANTVTLTATDASGNTSTCTSTVTVLDTISPVASCQDLTVYLDGAGTASITTGDVDNGSTDNCSIASSSLDVSTFTCANTGANTVTFTVTDASGNTSSCTSTVTVVDSTSPTASCQDITAYLDASGNVTITTGDVDNGSSDNCSIASMALDQTAFTCSDEGTNLVTLTVTDASGNVSTCSSNVIVLDTISPVVSCQDITVYLDGSGNVTITAGDVDNGSTDNCDPPSLSIDVASFTCANTGANTITLTATDASGNTSTCASTVTVLDTISPVASCQDLTVYLDGAGTASITTGDVDNGSSDNCSIASSSLDVSTFTCANTGANTVTFTVTDASGNTSSCTSTVTVVDSTSPTASCQDITAYLDASGNVTITAADVDNGSTDNCGTSLAIDVSTFTCANVGGNTVTLTVTDPSGNVSTCTSTVTVLDTVSPVASCQNLTIYLDAAGNATLVAADVDNGSTDNCSTPTLAIDVASFTCANIGANTVTLTATDASGNTSTCTSTVAVLDTISPVITCPGDQFETPNASCQFTLPDYTSLASGTDNCGTVTITQSPAAGTIISISTTLTLTADDGNGNTSTCTFDVNVIDNSDPLTPTLADITEECSVTVTPPTTTDNCAGTITGTTTDPLTYTTQGTYTITWTFDDGNGNSITVPQNVTILDITAPTATNPDTMYVECIADAVVDINVVDDAADNCIAIVTWNNDVVSGNGCQDTIVRTYTVSDDAGNSIDVTQIIIVEDITPPTVPAQGTVTVQCIDNFPGPDPNSVVGETDNCSTPTVAWVSDVSDGLSCPETVTRTYSVTDNCGNSVLIDQLIMINDVSAPVPDSTSLPMITQDCGESPIAPTATDNCSGTVTGTSDVPLPLTAVGTTTITWTFTDDCGNTSTQTQDVVVNAFDNSTWMASDGITIVASNTNTGVTYQWIDCSNNQPIPGETNHNFTPTYGGDFAVVINQNGCIDTSDCVNSTVGLDDLNGLTSVNLVIFPNPTTDGNFFIKLDGAWVGEVTVEMVDSRGRLIYTEVTSEELLTVKLDNLQHGTYFIEARDEQDNVLTRRLVTIND